MTLREFLARYNQTNTNIFENDIKGLQFSGWIDKAEGFGGERIYP